MSVILVTGANRGLGRALVEKYLARPDWAVVATVRSIDKPDAQSLNDLPKACGSRLIIVKFDASKENDAAAAMKLLSDQGVTKFDIIIANHGLYNLWTFKPIKDISTVDLSEHFDVTVAGVVRIFQAGLPLLEKSSRPLFVAMSSIVGSISGMDGGYQNAPAATYGTSKAALNWVVRKIHFEHPDIIVIAAHPGEAKTEHGNESAKWAGRDENFIEVEDSINGLVAKFDNATRENSSGKFLAWNDQQLLW